MWGLQCTLWGADGISLPKCQVLDVVKIRQGEDSRGFLGNTSMIAVNWRGDKDEFTCMSGRASSVGDYCIVDA